MNMPPRPSQMMLNQDALALRQPPASPDAHQGKMLSQQMAQDVGEHAKTRGVQQNPAMAEEMRGQMMNYDSAVAHADALALNTKDAVLQAMSMKGVPLTGMQGVRAVAQDMGIA